MQATRETRDEETGDGTLLERSLARTLYMDWDRI